MRCYEAGCRLPNGARSFGKDYFLGMMPFRGNCTQAAARDLSKIEDRYYDEQTTVHPPTQTHPTHHRAPKHRQWRRTSMLVSCTALLQRNTTFDWRNEEEKALPFEKVKNRERERTRERELCSRYQHHCRDEY